MLAGTPVYSGQKNNAGAAHERYAFLTAKTDAAHCRGAGACFAVALQRDGIRQRDRWTVDLARINTGMGIVVLAILLLANSPVLDFRRISLTSQLARVEAGEIELADFDFWYTHTTLARPGYMALEDIKTELADTQPQLLARIENPQPPGHSGALPDPAGHR